MKVKVFIGPINYDLDKLYKQEENEYLIGVDQGAMYALKKGLKLDLALGDFDSVTQEESLYIFENTNNKKVYQTEKNETDSYLAIEEALNLNPKSIEVYGGMGKRLDHTLGNIMLLMKGDITFINDDTKMFILRPGKHFISNPYKYISFFAVQAVESLTLDGFYYPLKHHNLLKYDPLCISNKGSGSVKFDSGSLLVIMTNE